MKHRIGSQIVAYGTAALLVAAAFGLRWSVQGLLGDHAPLEFFTLASIAAAIFGGIGPGLLAMVCGHLIGDYFFVPPYHTLGPATPLEWAYTGLFFPVTGACIAFIEALRRARSRAEKNRELAEERTEQLRRSVQEMTEAEATIRELASVVASAHDAIITAGLDGQVKSWNAAAETLFGFTAAEMIGSSVGRIIPSDAQSEMTLVLERLAGGQSIEPFETVRLVKDGRQIDVAVNYSPLKSDSGQIVGASMISRDITSRKQAEHEVERLNRDLNDRISELHRMLDVLPIGVGIAYDPECRFIQMNTYMARLLSLPAEANGSMTAPAQERPQHFTIWQDGHEVPGDELPMQVAAAQNREIHDWRAEVRRNGAAPLHFMVSAAPLYDLQGKVRGAIGAFVDITELKRTNAELQASEKRFQAMGDTAPLLIWMADANQHYTWVNQSWLNFTGRTLEQELGDGWTEAIHPEDLPACMQSFKAAFARMEPFELEYRLRSKQGEYRWLLDRGVPHFGPDGELVGYIGSCVDLTERKKTEDALEDKYDELRRAQGDLRERNQQLEASRQELELERSRYRELFNSAPTGYIVTSRQGVIHQVNTAAASMLNESPEFLVGFPLARLLAKGDRAAFFANIGRLTRGEVNRIENWEAQVQAHNRPAFPCSLIVNLVQDDLSRLTGLRWIIRDITERKLAEARVLRLNAELEQRVRERTAALEAANRELEAFSYSVSHDLRAPLRSINGFSKAVLEQYADRLDAQGVKYLQYAHDASVRMSRLIEDLMELSRVNRGELRRAEVDLTALATLVCAELRKSDPKRNLELIIQSNLTVHGDEGLLRIALDNLLGNAWKFTSKKQPAKVELGVSEQDGRRVFFIRDNGAGFNMANAGRLFGVFQRLHSQEEFPVPALAWLRSSASWRAMAGRFGPKAK